MSDSEEEKTHKLCNGTKTIPGCKRNLKVKNYYANKLGQLRNPCKECIKTYEKKRKEKLRIMEENLKTYEDEEENDEDTKSVRSNLTMSNLRKRDDLNKIIGELSIKVKEYEYDNIELKNIICDFELEKKDYELEIKELNKRIEELEHKKNKKHKEKKREY